MYRKKARIFLLIEAIIVIVLQVIGFGGAALVGATALLTLSVMLVLGKFKNGFSIVSKYTR